MNIVNQGWHLTNCVGNHRVQVYDNEICQEEAVALYVQEGLLNGEAIIVFAKPALRRTIISKIDLLGFDVQAIRSSGQIKFFDADLWLSSLHIDDVLDEPTFQERMVNTLQMSRSTFGKVRVYSGMIDAFWKEKQSVTAMQLESFWTKLAQIQEFSLLCSYSLEGLDDTVFEASLRQVSECHRHLIPCDSSESTTREARQDTFDAALNRVMDNLTTSPTLPSGISQTTLLN